MPPHPEGEKETSESKLRGYFAQTKLLYKNELKANTGVFTKT